MNRKEMKDFLEGLQARVALLTKKHWVDAATPRSTAYRYARLEATLTRPIRKELVEQV